MRIAHPEDNQGSRSPLSLGHACPGLPKTSEPFASLTKLGSNHKDHCDGFQVARPAQRPCPVMSQTPPPCPACRETLWRGEGSWRLPS